MIADSVMILANLRRNVKDLAENRHFHVLGAVTDSAPDLHLRISRKDAICDIHKRKMVLRVRDLERLLTSQGVSAAKMDGITRKLRESGRLPTGGRGNNAPSIGPNEAASILIAVAGTPKANEADMRVAKLEPLLSEGRAGTRTLLEAVMSLLADPAKLDAITEVRIARTRRRATFIFRSGKVEEFRTAKPNGQDDRFYVEGILAAPLLKLVARAIQIGEAGKATLEGEVNANDASPPSVSSE
ncbi:MAG: hypothetical protein H0U53_06865 [Actinobacteria bacterium]|nr:hypothetical protein [Actinomycetota bacterium]